MPTFDYQPSVYVGNITFITQDKTPAGLFLTFRYIIMGKVVGIDSIISEKTSIEKGQTLTVKVNYSGAPADNITFENTKIGIVTLRVKVINETGTTIGQGEETIDADDQSMTTKNVHILARESGKKISVEAQIIKDGSILGEYSSTLSPPEETNKLTLFPLSKKIIYSFIIFLIFLMGIMVLKSKGKKVITIFLLGLSLTTPGLTIPNTSRAASGTSYFQYTSSSHTSVRDLTFDLTGVNPIPYYLNPGESFYISGTYVGGFCANGHLQGSTSVSISGGGSWSWGWNIQGSGGHHHGVFSQGFGYWVSAPTQPGVYNVNFSTNALGPSINGYWQIQVIPPPPSINYFNGGPLVTIPGIPAYLNWSSNNASSCTVWGSSSGLPPVRSGYPVYPNQDTSYSLTCYNSAGVSASYPYPITVSILRINSFGGSPPIIAKGGSENLFWSSNHASNCVIPGVGTFYPGSSATVSPIQDTTYTLQCSNGGVSITYPTPVTVKVLSIDSFGTSSLIASGESATLTWTSHNAISCSLSDGSKTIASGLPGNGSHPISPQQDTSYTLTCTNGSVSYTYPTQVTIKILDIPIFTIDPKEINRGQQATLTWITKNASTCTASSNPNDSTWIYTNPPKNDNQQSKNVTPPNLPPGSILRNYSLTCTGPSGIPSLTKSIPAPGLKVHTLLPEFQCSMTGQPGSFGDCSTMKLVAGTTIYFKDTSSPTPQATIASRAWIFTNAKPAGSNTATTKTSFLTEGTQTATLVVTDSAGETETITKTFKISKPSFQETAPQ
ncbi:MAG: hypothetical protein HZA35_03615 [Parcubacteria group bacterium]|nr:hypothetical protein [Parcubacteria group bacterium]